MGNIYTSVEEKAVEIKMNYLLEETYIMNGSEKIINLEKCLIYAKDNHLIKYQHAIEGDLIREKLKPLY